LFNDFKSGRQRFGEDRGVVAERVGYSMQVLQGQAELLGEATGPAQDAEHCPSGAMPTQIPSTPIAIPTCRVNLADYSSPDEVRLTGAQDLTDKFMAEHALVAHVSGDDFQVGRTDAGTADTDAGFPRTFNGGRTFDKVEISIKDECSHKSLLIRFCPWLKPPC
jgi:hypothetical protein